MAFSNLMREYRDFKHQIEGLPHASPMRMKLKKERSDFLESVRDKYGQQVVDIICGAPRVKTKTPKELLQILREAGLHA